MHKLSLITIALIVVAIYSPESIAAEPVRYQNGAGAVSRTSMYDSKASPYCAVDRPQKLSKWNPRGASFVRRTQTPAEMERQLKFEVHLAEKKGPITTVDGAKTYIRLGEYYRIFKRMPEAVVQYDKAIDALEGIPGKAAKVELEKTKRNRYFAQLKSKTGKRK